jgi:hypothetical protein
VARAVSDEMMVWWAWQIAHSWGGVLMASALGRYPQLAADVASQVGGRAVTVMMVDYHEKRDYEAKRAGAATNADDEGRPHDS